MQLLILSSNASGGEPQKDMDHSLDPTQETWNTAKAGPNLLTTSLTDKHHL